MVLSLTVFLVCWKYHLCNMGVWYGADIIFWCSKQPAPKVIFFSEFWRKCVMIKLRVDKILHKSEISYSVPGPIVVYWNIFIISWFVCTLLVTSISFKCICPETNRSSVCTKSNKHFKEDERFKRSTSHIRKIGENVKQVLRIQMTSIKATCCRAAWEGTYYTASRHIARSQYYSQHHCTEFSSLQGVPKKLLTECFWSHGAQSQSLVDGTPCVRKLFFCRLFLRLRGGI